MESVEPAIERSVLSSLYRETPRARRRLASEASVKYLHVRRRENDRTKVCFPRLVDVRISVTSPV